MARKDEAREENKLLAVFAYVDDTGKAIEHLKKEGFRIMTVYSPAPNEELDEALALKPSPVRYFGLLGGIFGGLFGFVLSAFTAAQWKFIVWGKPPIPWIPYVIETFEFTILFGVLSGFAGLLILGRMPRTRTPSHFHAGFTVDRYGILLSCPPQRRDDARRLLKENGAEEIRDA